MVALFSVSTTRIQLCKIRVNVCSERFSKLSSNPDGIMCLQVVAGAAAVLAAVSSADAFATSGASLGLRPGKNFHVHI